MNDSRPSEKPQQQVEADAERSLLGAILLSGGKPLDYLNFNPGDYHQPIHGHIHAAAQRLRNQGKPADQVTVADELAHRQVTVDAAYLHQLAGTTATPSAAEHYAAIIQDAAARRRALEAATTIKEGVLSHADPQLIQETAQKALDGITPATQQDPVRFIGEVMDTTIEELSSDPVFLPSSWKSLDSLIGGFRPGALYTVGARTSVGKSVFGIQSAVHLAKQGSVAMFSTEMSTTDLHTRAISSAAKVSVTDLEYRRVSDHDWDKIAAARQWLDPLPLSILDRGSATMADVRRFILATHKRNPLAAVVIDYLQRIRPPAGDQRPRWQFIGDTTRDLKTLAMDLNVPVILIAQLNRESTKADVTLPEMHHLQDSGSIEQDSDVVILLHRDLSTPEGQSEITFKVAKNRRGQLGNRTLEFAGHYSTIRDY